MVGLTEECSYVDELGEDTALGEVGPRVADVGDDGEHVVLLYGYDEPATETPIQ